MGNGNNVLLIWPDRDKGFYNFDPIGLITGQKTLFFPLPLLYVAAALGNEWNYSLVDEGIEKLTEQEIDNADYFLISVNTLQRYATEDLLQRLIPRNKPIIIGGPLVSTLDHLFNHELITKVFGEIEAFEATRLPEKKTVAECLCADMHLHTLQKEYHAKGHPDIRNNLPPRYDLVKKSDYFSLSLQTSRGCPHHCDFCQQIILNGKHQRKTREQVHEELDALYKLGRNVTVLIIDDNMMGDIGNPDAKSEYMLLLDTIEKWQIDHAYPFDFFTQCSLDIAEHEDVVKKMSKIGLNIMFIGIESVDDDALASVHKKQNLERDMLKNISVLQKSGIGIFAGVIIGFDNESDATISKQIEFIEKTNIPLIAPTPLHALPGTRMYKDLLAQNRISRNPDALTNTFWSNIIPLQNPAVHYGYFYRYLDEVYNPKAYFARCIRWIKAWNDSYVIPGKKGSLPTNLRVKRILRSFVYQGILSDYRFAFYRYLIHALFNFCTNYNKLSLALYLGYMFQLANTSSKNAKKFVKNLPEEFYDEWKCRFPEAASEKVANGYQ